MIIILRGIPGSGKSRIAEYLTTRGGVRPMAPTSSDNRPLSSFLCNLAQELDELDHRNSGDRRSYSSDEFHLDADGRYQFDPANLSAAHAWCLRGFVDHLAFVGDRDKAAGIAPEGLRPRSVLVVDNTNTTIAEVAPYAQLAAAFGHPFHVLTLLADPLTAWKRQVHEVPITNVVKQHLQLEQSIREWPPWWPQKAFPV